MTSTAVDDDPRMLHIVERISGARVFGWLVGFPPVRESGRVLLLDDGGRALLGVGANFAGGPTYLHVIGGGLHAGESALDAAVREIGEETGYRFEAGALVGPIALREATFDFSHLADGSTWLSREHIFAARIRDAVGRGPTAYEESELCFGGGQTLWCSRSDARAYRLERSVVEPGYQPAALFDLWDAAEAALTVAGR